MATWVLPYAATLGSSVRKRGIFLEVRARLSEAARKSLKISEGTLVVSMTTEDQRQFRAACRVVAETLEHIESLPVIPREVEDILQISSTERHRWLKDGRLPSVGTRTVKLRGRARQVTFHVFDPRVLEDLLDRDRVTEWREDDAAVAAENRRRAAWKAKLTRAATKDAVTKPARESDRPETASKLAGWEEFVRNGPLR